MGFGNLKTEAGLQSLNCYLSDKSFIEGYVPSQGDVAVFNAVGSAPNAKFVNALRWFNQISSYNEDNKLAFPGVQKPIEQYGAESSAGTATGGADDDDDDDFDPFASGDDDEDEAERLRQEKLKQIEENKKKKKVVIAKSNIVLDVKPWDDETNMADIEAHVRSIQTDGLIWRASKLVDLAYGIKKLQISCIVEDDKVGMDFLEEKITENEDLVQSVDIAAFNKV